MSASKLDIKHPGQSRKSSGFESTGFRYIYDYLSQDHVVKPGILDLAPANHEVIQFVSECGGIYYTSSSLTKGILAIEKQSSEKELTNSAFSDLFRKQLNPLNKRREMEPLDAIFVWDLFNYLKRENIIRLMTYLSSMCKKNTLLHSLLWHTDYMPSTPGEFTLVTPNTIKYRFNSADMMPSPAFYAQSIVGMMPSFRPFHMLALESGFLEVVLEFNEYVEPPDPNISPSANLSGLNRKKT